MRVAGSVSKKIRDNPAARNLRFLGHLGPGQLGVEFANADVFVFPSLAEGSASVVNEAMAMGVPVVTTKAAGSIIHDGIDGLIVKERDPAATANAIHSLISNRNLNYLLSAAAVHSISERSLKKWGDEIFATLQGIL